MKTILLSLTLVAMLTPELYGQSLNEYRWKSRVLLIFTPSADDPMFQQQFVAIDKANEGFQERQVQIIMMTPKGEHENTGIFLESGTSERYYRKFAVEPFQMETILIGLDGKEKFRSRNVLTPPSAYFDLIDSMPMRRREIRQGYQNKSQIKSKNKTPYGKSGGR